MPISIMKALMRLTSKITLAISDLYPSDGFRQLLSVIALQLPELELECLIAENDDIIASIQRGRAHIGLVAASPAYAADLKHFTLNRPSEMVLVTSPEHPLSLLPEVTLEHLGQYQELKVEPFERTEHPLRRTSGEPRHCSG